jgi:hypothetical protein
MKTIVVVLALATITPTVQREARPPNTLRPCQSLSRRTWRKSRDRCLCDCSFCNDVRQDDLESCDRFVAPRESNRRTPSSSDGRLRRDACCVRQNGCRSELDGGIEAARIE